MMRTIFDPITVTASSPAVEITLPATLRSAASSNSIVELQVYSCAGIVELVGASNQTKGSTIPPVDANSYNAVAHHADLRGFSLFAYAATDAEIVLIPVLTTRRR